MLRSTGGNVGPLAYGPSWSPDADPLRRDLPGAVVGAPHREEEERDRKMQLFDKPNGNGMQAATV